MALSLDDIAALERLGDVVNSRRTFRLVANEGEVFLAIPLQTLILILPYLEAKLVEIQSTEAWPGLFSFVHLIQNHIRLRAAPSGDSV